MKLSHSRLSLPSARGKYALSIVFLAATTSLAKADIPDLPLPWLQVAPVVEEQEVRKKPVKIVIPNPEVKQGVYPFTILNVASPSEYVEIPRTPKPRPPMSAVEYWASLWSPKNFYTGTILDAWLDKRPYDYSAVAHNLPLPSLSEKPAVMLAKAAPAPKKTLYKSPGIIIKKETINLATNEIKSEEITPQQLAQLAPAAGIETDATSVPIIQLPEVTSAPPEPEEKPADTSAQAPVEKPAEAAAANAPPEPQVPIAVPDAAMAPIIAAPPETPSGPMTPAEETPLEKILQQVPETPLSDTVAAPLPPVAEPVPPAPAAIAEPPKEFKLKPEAKPDIVETPPLVVEKPPAPPAEKPVEKPAVKKAEKPKPEKKSAVAPTADDSEPKPGLSKATRAIAKTIPSDLDKKELSAERLNVDRTKDLSQLFVPPADATQEGQAVPQKTEAMGIKIEVKPRPINWDYELEKAYIALTNGYTTQAIETYKNVLDNDPDNKNALFGLATTYHRAGQLDKARPLYGRLLALDPNHRDALNNFMVLMADEAPEEALLQLEQLEKRNPQFSPIPAQMAVIFQKLGNLDKASEKMFKAIELAPENLAYRYNLAVMLDKQGNHQEAARLYRQILEAHQRGEATPGNIEKIQERLTFIGSNRP